MAFSSYDERDRLVAVGTETLSWDEDGRLLSRGGANGYDVTWDSQDRAVEILYAGGSALDNTYDHDGSLVRSAETSSTAGFVENDFLVSNVGSLAHVVAQIDVGSSSLEMRYVRAAEFLLAGRGPVPQYYHSDQVHSVRGLSTDSGAIATRYGYSAFGAVEDRSGAESTNRYLYAGERFDAAGLLSFNRARWMDPSAGRFFSIDPHAGESRIPASLHRYSYANLNPIKFRDPSGLFSIGENTTALSGQNHLRSASTINTKAYFTLRRTAALALLIPAGATAVSPRLAGEVDQSRRRGERRRGLSVFIPARDTAATTHHIMKNIGSRPENSTLTKFSGRSLADPRSWYGSVDPSCGVGGECDEYPFFSSLEGGRENYPSRVTLQTVPRGESAVQGGHLRAFYSSCDIPDGGRYIVSPSPLFSRTTWICGTRL